MVIPVSTHRLTPHLPSCCTRSGVKPEPSSTPMMMIMPWRSRTRMPMRTPAKAAMVEKTQAPSIQASGIFSQLKTKPPTVPITMASASGFRPSWPMMCFFSGLKGIALLLKDRTDASRPVSRGVTSALSRGVFSVLTNIAKKRSLHSARSLPRAKSRGASVGMTGGSWIELLFQYALFEIVLGIEQQGEVDVGRFGHRDLGDVGDLDGIGGGGDGALARIEDGELD